MDTPQDNLGSGMPFKAIEPNQNHCTNEYLQWSKKIMSLMVFQKKPDQDLGKFNGVISHDLTGGYKRYEKMFENNPQVIVLSTQSTYESIDINVFTGFLIKLEGIAYTIEGGDHSPYKITDNSGKVLIDTSKQNGPLRQGNNYTLTEETQIILENIYNLLHPKMDTQQVIDNHQEEVFENLEQK